MRGMLISADKLAWNNPTGPASFLLILWKLAYPESFPRYRILILLNEGIASYTSGMVNFLGILLHYDCDAKLQ